MMKIAFYFTWIALVVLKMSKLLSWIFGHEEKRLDFLNKVNLEIYDLKIWLKIIAIHIVPNISRSKVNQTMKFGQLIEYNMKTFFLISHTQNVVEKLFPYPFLNNQNWVCPWISNQKFYTVFFYCMLSWVLLKYIETKLQTTWFYLIEVKEVRN